MRSDSQTYLLRLLYEGEWIATIPARTAGHQRNNEVMQDDAFGKVFSNLSRLQKSVICNTGQYRIDTHFRAVIGQ